MIYYKSESIKRENHIIFFAFYCKGGDTVKVKSNELKLRIAEKAMTNKDFAKCAKLSIATVSRAINQDSNFNSRTIGRICAALNCQPMDIAKFTNTVDIST